jgi:hypothetical protein
MSIAAQALKRIAEEYKPGVGRFEKKSLKSELLKGLRELTKLIRTDHWMATVGKLDEIESMLKGMQAYFGAQQPVLEPGHVEVKYRGALRKAVLEHDGAWAIREIRALQNEVAKLRLRTSIIRHENGKWILSSHKGKVLGRHPSKEKALKQEQAIQIPKRRSRIVGSESFFEKFRAFCEEGIQEMYNEMYDPEHPDQTKDLTAIIPQIHDAQGTLELRAVFENQFESSDLYDSWLRSCMEQNHNEEGTKPKELNDPQQEFKFGQLRVAVARAVKQPLGNSELLIGLYGSFEEIEQTFNLLYNYGGIGPETRLKNIDGKHLVGSDTFAYFYSKRGDLIRALSYKILEVLKRKYPGWEKAPRGELFKQAQERAAEMLDALPTEYVLDEQREHNSKLGNEVAPYKVDEPEPEWDEESFVPPEGTIGN